MTDWPALATRWETRLERWSDRLNPVVVREVRQSFKARMFLGIFMILLGVTWLGSVTGILSQSTAVNYYELGPEFFQWYLLALIACLVFAIPAGAFFSMVQEFRDKSYEVLAITALSPQKIIFGKLEAAVVMMLIYSSAVAPYLCLSYLLGGLSLLSLLLALTAVAAASLSMCLFAVMLGSLAQKPWAEVVNLIVLLFGSAITAGILYNGLIVSLLRETDIGGLIVGMGCFAVFFGFAALISFGVAQSQLTTTYLPLNYRRNLQPVTRTDRPVAASAPAPDSTET